MEQREGRETEFVIDVVVVVAAAVGCVSTLSSSSREGDFLDLGRGCFFFILQWVDLAVVYLCVRVKRFNKPSPVPNLVDAASSLIILLSECFVIPPAQRRAGAP